MLTLARDSCGDWRHAAMRRRLASAAVRLQPLPLPPMQMPMSVPVSLRLRLQRRLLPSLVLLTLLLLLSGCASEARLAQVREFADGAPKLAGFADLSARFRDTYKREQPYLSPDADTRERIIDRKRHAAYPDFVALHQAVTGYLHALRALSGKGQYDFSGEARAMSAGIKAWPDTGLLDRHVDAYSRLVRLMTRYGGAREQDLAVQAMLRDGYHALQDALDAMHILLRYFNKNHDNEQRIVMGMLEVEIPYADTPQSRLLAALAKAHQQEKASEYRLLGLRHTLAAKNVDELRARHAQLLKGIALAPEDYGATPPIYAPAAPPVSAGAPDGPPAATSAPHPPGLARAAASAASAPHAGGPVPDKPGMPPALAPAAPATSAASAAQAAAPRAAGCSACRAPCQRRPGSASMSANAPHVDNHALEALADSLSACADALHARLLRALRRQQPMQAGLSQAAAQALFENEVALRQQANNLYVDAAGLSLHGMGATQQELLQLAIQARAAVHRVNQAKDLLGISAGLLGVAAAIAAMQPERLVSPLQDLRARLASLQDDNSA